MPTIRFHQDLKVFQKSVEFAMMIFELTNYFPKEELYSPTDQSGVHRDQFLPILVKLGEKKI
ncbi:four helix bundle protein [Chryseobacterium sp. JK1]